MRACAHTHTLSGRTKTDGDVRHLEDVRPVVPDLCGTTTARVVSRKPEREPRRRGSRAPP